MDPKNKIVLSDDAKKTYLVALIGKMLKILHLVGEESKTGFSPRQFIEGQLVELNSANELFDGKLVTIIVKLNSVLNTYQEVPFEAIKKQIFEIKKNIEYLLKQVDPEG